MNRFGGLLLLVLVAGLVMLSLGGDPTGTAPGPSASEQPRYVMRGVELHSFDAQGNAQFQGQASSIEVFDDQSARLDDFRVQALAGEGAPWTASAPQGYAPPGTRTRLQLLGGVEGRGRWPDGEPLQFRSEDLWVETDVQRLHTASRVQLDSASRKARGRGLEVTATPAGVVLMNEVEMRYAPR